MTYYSATYDNRGEQFKRVHENASLETLVTQLKDVHSKMLKGEGRNKWDYILVYEAAPGGGRGKVVFDTRK